MNSTSKRRIVAVDFDGVIHKAEYVEDHPSDIADRPVPGAFQFLYDLMNSGFHVVLFTARARDDRVKGAIRAWFFKNGMTRIDIGRMLITNVKPPALIFIDDRAFQFKGTFPTINYIRGFKAWNEK